jgi:hypothetical protein
MRVQIRVLSILALLSAAFSSGPLAAADDPKLTPLVAEIIAPPHVVPGSDGKRHLVYELAVTNITGGAVRFEQLKVIDPPARRRLRCSGRTSWRNASRQVRAAAMKRATWRPTNSRSSSFMSHWPTGRRPRRESRTKSPRIWQSPTPI